MMTSALGPLADDLWENDSFLTPSGKFPEGRWSDEFNQWCEFGRSRRARSSRRCR
jgi:hypothetical protein